MIIKRSIRSGLSRADLERRLERHRFKSVFMVKSSFKLKRFKIFALKIGSKIDSSRLIFERSPSLTTLRVTEKMINPDMGICIRYRSISRMALLQCNRTEGHCILKRSELYSPSLHFGLTK